VLLWDVASGGLLTTLHGHRGPVGGLAFSPDGRALATGGSDPNGTGEVRLWQVPASAGRRLLEGHTAAVSCATYSHDGKVLATGGQDKTVKLWDTATGAERATLRGFPGPLLCLRFSPDGKVLAAACQGDKTVTLCSLAGKVVLTVPTLQITGIAFAPDGKLLASSAGGDGGGEVKLWDVDTGKEVASLPRQPQGVRSVTFSPDGRALAIACGRQVKVFHLPTLIEQTQLSHAGLVSQVAYAPDGVTLATGQDNGAVTLYDMTTGGERAKLEGQSGTLSSMAFSPDGRLLAAAVQGGPPKVWLVPAAK
jgi:WD40 repeat protein